MPKKIEPSKAMEWTEMSRSGMSIAAIAGKAKKDPRTVKANIDIVAAEEERTAVRRAALERSMGRHWEALINLLARFSAELRDSTFVLNPNTAFAPADNPTFTAYGLDVAQNEQGDFEASVPGALEWELLGQHLKGEPAWKAFDRFLESVASAVDAEWRFAKFIGDALKRATGLEIRDAGKSLIPRSGLQVVTIQAVGYATGDREDFAKLAKGLVLEPGASGIRYRGQALVVGAGTKEMLGRLRRVIGKLPRTEQFRALLVSRTALSARAKELVRQFGLIVTVAYLPGKCDACERLRI